MLKGLFIGWGYIYIYIYIYEFAAYSFDCWVTYKESN